MGYDGADDTVIRVRAPGRPETGSAPAAPPPSRSALSGFAEDEVLEGETIIPDRSTRPSERQSAEASLRPEDPPTRPAVTVTRYRLRVNGEQPVELDRMTIVGRRPGATRIPGRDEPRLIAVPSPQDEVSSNHARIVQEGGSVVVTDLRSTNGTTVTLPSSERVRLRPGESFVAVPGSLIDIGDGNVMEILTAERLLPTDGWTT